MHLNKSLSAQSEGLNKLEKVAKFINNLSSDQGIIFETPCYRGFGGLYFHEDK